MGDYLMGVMGWVFLGCFILSVAAYLVTYNDVTELGQAICEKEYGMDFKEYFGTTLKCKDVKSSQYDGVEVVTGGS